MSLLKHIHRITIFCGLLLIYPMLLFAAPVAVQKNQPAIGIVTEKELQKQEISYEEFWMFYSRLKLPKYQLLMVHPLFLSENYWTKDVDQTFYKHFFRKSIPYVSTQHISLLPPLLDIYRIPGLVNYNSFEIIDYSYKENNLGKESDFAIYPFLWLGRGDKPSENYFALFPFGGTIRGKLITDYITFVLFPIWVKYGDSRTSYYATSLYYPFFMMGKGPNRTEIRMFPFYRYTEITGSYQKWGFLWPFFYYERNFLNSSSPQSLGFFMPVYGFKIRDGARSFSLFYPFFSWGADKETGAREYNMPWPLIQIQDVRNPYTYKRYFFPFYGIYKFRKKSARYITPFYFDMENVTNRYRTRQTFFLPMLWVSERYGTSARTGFPEKRSFFMKFWPFFHYLDDSEQGDFRFNMLSPLFYSRESDIDRIFSPVWSLITVKSVSFNRLSNREKYIAETDPQLLNEESYQQKFRYFSLFFRLLSHWEIGDTQHWQIPLLVSFTSKQGSGHRISFLYGLFEYDTLLQAKENSIDTKKSKKDKKEEKKSQTTLFWFIKI